MDRIAESFNRARNEGRSSFIAYVCAGDPDAETSLEVCRTLLKGGVDILELGVPFSDPLADGLTNQLAAQRALESGMTQQKVFELTRQLREEFPDRPIVYYTYYNLVYSRGIEAYAKEAAEAGVDALLTLDLPPEEADELLAACKQTGLRNIFLIAPTTPDERIQIITDAASGFIYYVSGLGVTGERDRMAEGIAERVTQIKKHTDLPVVVGFGVSRAEHVRQIGSVADGIVVGSALVNRIRENLGDRNAICKAIGDKLSELREGLK